MHHSLFSITRHKSSILFWLKFYTLSTKWACQSTNLVSSRKSNILNFDSLLLSKSYKFSAKKVQKSYLSWNWRVMQSLKKNWLVVWNMTWVILWIFTQPLKNTFCPKYTRFELQKYRGVIMHDAEQTCKIWINPDLVASKMAREIGWTFIRAIKSLKNCTLMGSFCLRYIMFQLESFIGIICHDTEGWCKI